MSVRHPNPNQGSGVGVSAREGGVTKGGGGRMASSRSVFGEKQFKFNFRNVVNGKPEMRDHCTPCVGAFIHQRCNTSGTMPRPVLGVDVVDFCRRGVGWSGHGAPRTAMAAS